ATQRSIRPRHDETSPAVARPVGERGARTRDDRIAAVPGRRTDDGFLGCPLLPYAPALSRSRAGRHDDLGRAHDDPAATVPRYATLAGLSRPVRGTGAHPDHPDVPCERLLPAPRRGETG